MARSEDPIIDDMLLVACKKISVERAEVIETEKRSRSIVVPGIEEEADNLPPYER